jgi:LacI family transcriptional regulator
MTGARRWPRVGTGAPGAPVEPPVPTMKDVALAARVSIATVSAALSGAAYVSPELRERVLEAVRALGYAPNSVASGLKRGITNLIGLIVPDISNPFYTEIVQHVQKGARRAGYSVLLCDSEQDVAREATFLRLMRAHQAAGTILCPTGGSGDYQTLAHDAGKTPVVAVDNGPADIGVDTVVLDNPAAAGLATRHILAFGHRRIATMAGPTRQLPGQERLRGFLATLQAAGAPLDPAMIRHGEFRQEDAFASCQGLLTLEPRPTAIFVANNHMLIGVMRAVAVAGLSCPRDLSIASIDDFPWAVAFTPTLTTVRQPVQAMAEAALALALERIAGRGGEPQRKIFPPELVIRNSCAAPPPD